jgi:hypothetical protein
VSSDPRHPEGWRILRDLDEREWDDDGYDARSGIGLPTRWNDPEAIEAMHYARQMREMREWGWCRP